MGGKIKLNLEEIECSTNSLMLGFIEHVNYIASSIREGIFVTSGVSVSFSGGALLYGID
jgi:hypothetical protein